MGLSTLSHFQPKAFLTQNYQNMQHMLHAVCQEPHFNMLNIELLHSFFTTKTPCLCQKQELDKLERKIHFKHKAYLSSHGPSKYQQEPITLKKGSTITNRGLKREITVPAPLYFHFNHSKQYNKIRLWHTVIVPLVSVYCLTSQCFNQLLHVRLGATEVNSELLEQNVAVFCFF